MLVEVIPSHTVTIGKTVEVTTMETKEPVEVSPSSTATVTVILLDGTKEIQRTTAHGEKGLARVKAGNPGS